MARVSVATQRITRAGLIPLLTAPTVDGDIVDTGQVALYVVNGSEATVIVTVASTAVQDGLAVANLTVTVAAGDTTLIGPLPARTFGQAADSAAPGRALITYSAVASVTRAVIAL